jgi:hypothetical protein
MKTTLVLDDSVMARVRREADRRGTTLSAVVEDALRRFLETPLVQRELPPLPVFDAGRALVDLADRDALERAMED